MAIIYLEIEDKYDVSSQEEPIVLKTIIGNGQGNHSTSVSLNGSFISGSETYNIPFKKIKNDDKIIVSSTVIDTNTQTNWVSLTVEFSKGASNKVFGPYSKEVANNLDTVIFIIVITMRK